MNTLDSSHPQKSGTHCGPRIASRHHGTRGTISNKFGAAHQGRVFLSADSPRRVFVHANDFAARKELKAEGVANKIRRSNEEDLDAKFIAGALGSCDNLDGREVATHCVNGDR
jgi:hypothetical protein